MLNISPEEIVETLLMITQQNLDIRTVTLGLSLERTAPTRHRGDGPKVYETVTARAERLVPVCEAISAEYGIPIVNRRIAVTPIAQLAAACRDADLTPLAAALDRAAAEVGVDFVGGFSALVHKGTGDADARLIDSIPHALSTTERVCASVNVASTRAGHQHGRRLRMAEVIRRDRRGSPPIATRSAAASSWSSATWSRTTRSWPVRCTARASRTRSSTSASPDPGVVRAVVSALPEDADLTAVAEAIKATAFKITRVGELIAREAAPARSGDGHRRPLARPHARRGRQRRRHHRGHRRRAVRRTGHDHRTRAAQRRRQEGRRDGHLEHRRPVGRVHPRLGGRRHGARGQRRRAHAGEARGDDERVLGRARHDRHPGRHAVETIAAIMADACAIGVINNKTTATRLIPAAGKRVGETVEYGGLFGSAPVMSVNGWAGTKLISAADASPLRSAVSGTSPLQRIQ
jgi:uncharacterized protein